jgi:hypothetical protein
VLNFYRRKLNAVHIAPVSRDFTENFFYKFYFLLPDEMLKFRGSGIRIVKRYPSGAVLAVRD